MINKSSLFYCLLVPVMISAASISAQSQEMILQGAIKLANAQQPIPDPGTIRWSGCDLEGWNGSSWVSLTGGTLSKEFGQVIGGDCLDVPNDLTYDSQGNIYIVGYFSCAFTLGQYTLTPKGSHDVFVAKFNRDGLVQWAVSGGGTGSDIGNGIATDQVGNVIVTGSFSGSADFSNTSITGLGLKDVFVAKYNSVGQLIWIETGGSTVNDEGSAVVTDSLGNIYISGAFGNVGYFDDLSSMTEGLADIFICKYASDGNVVWLKSHGGVGIDQSHDLAMDGGCLYGSFTFSDTVDFDHIQVASAGQYDIAMVKYDTAGGLIWLRSAGGSSFDYLHDIVIDNEGNIFGTGQFNDVASFGSSMITSVGGIDVFICKYTASGILEWVHSGGGSSADRGHGIDVDIDGDPIIIGSFFDAASFSGAMIDSPGSNTDVFIAQYDKNGLIQWVEYGGGLNIDEGRAIHVSDDSSIYLTGHFRDAATFRTCSLTSNGNFDTYLLKYAP